jgi:DNA-binding PadR family transcriptional regulator
VPRRATADKHLLRGAATLLILLVLRDTPCHGYRLVEELRRRSGEVFDFPEGTLYPLLHGLEREGAIRSEWRGGAAGRPRKIYRLTPGGLQELERRLAAWQKFSAGVEFALQGP